MIKNSPRPQELSASLSQTIKGAPIDIERLAQKANLCKQVTESLKQDTDRTFNPNSVAKELEKKFKQEIQVIKEKVKRNLQQSNRELLDSDLNPHWRHPQSFEEILIEGQDLQPMADIRSSKSPGSTGLTYAYKNRMVDEMGRLVFDRQFKGFLNHKEEILRKQEEKRQRMRQRKNKMEDEEEQLIRQEDILQNRDEDFDFKNAQQMQDAYGQIFNGKRPPSKAILKHAKKYEYEFRKREFAEIIAKQKGDLTHITKEVLVKYLFDNLHVMMLYSINPYTLGDEVSDYPTGEPNLLSFEQFSCFLLQDRTPTFIQYSQKVLEQARKLGKGIKCAPIIAKWIDNSGIRQMLLAIFRHGDIFGRNRAERGIIASKIKKQAMEKDIFDTDVILVVNINKKIPLSRLVFEIQYEDPGRDEWKLEEYINYIDNYHRLKTGQKDKIIQKQVLAGRYDVSYVFVVSQSVVAIVKECFAQLQKFAEYFVLKEAFLDKIYKHPNYTSIRNLKTRKEPYKNLPIETVEQTLIRIYYEAEEYCDIEEIVEFFTNRGRPRSVEHAMYLRQLQIQMIRLEQQQAAKPINTDSTDDEQDRAFARVVKQRRAKRFKEKMAALKRSLPADEGRTYNVTIPVPFQMDVRAAYKKPSIRERKLKEMLLEKEEKLKEELKPIPCKEVPWYVKENLYEKFQNEEERLRRIRLEQFRAELLQQMVPMPERLTQHKQAELHCELDKDTYKFIARPLPWYCEVELLERINKAKTDRRERILEDIINKHTSMDLPEGVKNMLERHEKLVEKRAQKTQQRSDSLPEYTFQPPKVKEVPNFKLIHENLQLDFQAMKREFVPTQAVGFDFEKRQRKARSEKRSEESPTRTLHRRRIVYKQTVNPASTKKHDALVEYRRRQAMERKQEEERLQQEENIRMIRKEKIAPYVQSVLRKSNVLSNSSRQQVNRLEQLQMEDRQKKAEYEAKMMEIYAKVLNRPLLVENSGQFGQNDVNRVSKLNYQAAEAVEYPHPQPRPPKPKAPVERKQPEKKAVAIPAQGKAPSAQIQKQNVPVQQPPQRQAQPQRQEIVEDAPKQKKEIKPIHRHQYQEQEEVYEDEGGEEEFMDEDEDGDYDEEGQMALEYMRQQQQNRQGHYSDDEDRMDHHNSF